MSVRVLLGCLGLIFVFQFRKLSMENQENEFKKTTAEKVKQMKGWENMSDEMADNIAKTVRRLSELFYITIAREQSLNPLSDGKVEIEKITPKNKSKRIQ
jgi:hypothetical protein